MSNSDLVGLFGIYKKNPISDRLGYRQLINKHLEKIRVQHQENPDEEVLRMSRKQLKNDTFSAAKKSEHKFPSILTKS